MSGEIGARQRGITTQFIPVRKTVLNIKYDKLMKQESERNTEAANRFGEDHDDGKQNNCLRPNGRV